MRRARLKRRADEVSVCVFAKGTHDLQRESRMTYRKGIEFKRRVRWHTGSSFVVIYNTYIKSCAERYIPAYNLTDTLSNSRERIVKANSVLTALQVNKNALALDYAHTNVVAIASVKQHDYIGSRAL